MIPVRGVDGQRIVVLGLGRSGKSAVRAIEAGGGIALCWDDSANTRQSAEAEGFTIHDVSRREAWEGVAALIVSPGIPHLYPEPNKWVARAMAAGVAVDNDIGLFFRSFGSGDWDHFDSPPKVIAITGSNGKSTTSALIHHCLIVASKESQLAGNIGRGVLDIEPPGDGAVVVLELSSYQTELARAVPSEGRLVSNIVMMGMGEPLYNFDNVKKALLIASDGDGLSLSKRRITLSTSGVVPEIFRTGDEIGCMLAISLHAVRDDLRDVLVPINKKWNIQALLDACRQYPGLSNAKRITFEYVMLKDVNDSNQDALDLVRLLKGIPAKINLIPFNPWPGSEYECSDWERIEEFADIVNRAGYASPIRTPRGRDIFAACGQLKSASERMRKKDREALAAS